MGGRAATRPETQVDRGDHWGARMPSMEGRATARPHCALGGLVNGCPAPSMEGRATAQPQHGIGGVHEVQSRGVRHDAVSATRSTGVTARVCPAEL